MKKKVTPVQMKSKTKTHVSNAIAEALTAAGFTVASGDDYGFKANTLVIRDVDVTGEPFDVQVSFTTPKAGLSNYDANLEDKEDEAAE